MTCRDVVFAVGRKDLQTAFLYDNDLYAAVQMFTALYVLAHGDDRMLLVIG